MKGYASSGSVSMIPPVLNLLLLDDGSNTDIVQHVLIHTRHPFNLSHSRSSAAAISNLDRVDVDCVLIALDDQTDERLDVVCSVHTVRPDIPIIAIVPRTHTATWTEAIRAGAQDFLIKDELSSAVLLQAIERQRLIVQTESCAKAATQSHDTLETVLEHLDDGIVVLDSRGRVLFANSTAYEWLGPALNGPLLLPERCDDFELIQPDSSTRRISIHSTRIAWQTCPNPRMVRLRDVTEDIGQKYRERRLAKSEHLAAIGRLVGGIAHEVNNPAALLVANIEYLQGQLFERDPDPTTAIPVLEECQAAVKRISGIVTDLRTCAHIADSELETLDLRDIVETACTFLREPLSSHVQLIKRLEDVPLVSIHRGKFLQVVMVLLGHALRATQSGGGQIIISTRRFAQTILLAVENNGEELDETEREQMFEPFALSEHSEGLGLGLALAREVVRVHQGELSVHSQPGQGTRFEVRLPIEPITSLSALQAPEQAPDTPRRRRLLLVDDELPFLRAMSRLLSRRYDIHISPSAKDALSLDHAHYDAIVCDLMMPGVDGPAFYRSLQAKDPTSVNRIVFATGGAFSDDVRSFLDEVRNPVLQKPFSAVELTETVERMLQVCSATSGGHSFARTEPPGHHH